MTDKQKRQSIFKVASSKCNDSSHTITDCGKSHDIDNTEEEIVEQLCEYRPQKA